MKLPIITFCLGCLLGVGAMWISQDKPTSTADPEQEKTRVAERERAQSRTAEASRDRDFFEEYVALKRSGERREKLIDLSAEELQRLINLVLTRSDSVNGMSYKDKGYLQELLTQLAKLDFTSSMAWIEARFPGESSNGLKLTLLEALAKQDFDASLTYTVQLSKGELRQKMMNKLLYMTFRGKNEKMSEQAQAVISQMSFRMGGASGRTVDYGDDFDFSAFGKAALARVAEAEGEERLATFPTNFLEEWVKKSPEEAIDFYNEHLLGKERDQQLPFNDLSELATGYLTTTSLEKGAEWVEGIFRAEAVSKDEKNLLLRAIFEEEAGGALLAKQLIDHQGTEAEKIEMSGNFLSAFKRNFGGSTDMHRKQILELFPSPEARLTYLMENAGEYRWIADKLTENLESLNHSQAEIEAFRQAAKTAR